MRRTQDWLCGLAVVCSVAVFALGCGGGQKPAGGGSKPKGSGSASGTSNEGASGTVDKSDASGTSSTSGTTNGTSGSGSTTASSGWGNFRGRFVFDGTAPEAAKLTVDKDTDTCGKHDIRDESVVVNTENGGLANVVVYLAVRSGDKPPAAHESYNAAAESKVVLDNLNCRFEPHVALVRTNQPLLVGNKDDVGHNTKVETFENPTINPITPAGGNFEHTYSRAERKPARVSCSIHSWMSAWVLVQDHPYSAVSDKDGNFEIKNLPVGNWTFIVWHEKAEYVNQVTIGGAKQDWGRGRVTVDVKADATTDLGEIKVAPSLFN